MEKEKARTVTVEISEQEWQIIRLMREIEYGELLVMLQAGRPLRVEEIRKSIKIN